MATLRKMGRGDGRMNYKEWLAKYEDEIYILFAETGYDKKFDYDPEGECERLYQLALYGYTKRFPLID